MSHEPNISKIGLGYVVVVSYCTIVRPGCAVSYESVGAIVALRCVPLKGGWLGLTPEEASVPTPIPDARQLCASTTVVIV